MNDQRGFTLLEVVVALAILAISLVVLLESQASSLQNAARARDLTIASLLARGKMIDIEQKLFHDGFTLGTQEESGDFSDEGYPNIQFQYALKEVNFDLNMLSSLCPNQENEQNNTGMAGSCQSMISGVGAPLNSLTEEMAKTIRLAELIITWGSGKYKESMKVHALLTRDDFNMSEQGVAEREIKNIAEQQGVDINKIQPNTLVPGGVNP